jgi:hypothetical protein
VLQKLRRQTIDDDLDKYRPKHFFKPPEIEAREHKLDPDDYAWESTYQIGPETLLLPVKGAEFNARVRDYRRELWGDGAPYVRQGILGWRNADITVRERRRFTDLIREEPLIAQSVDTVNADLQERHEGAIRRVQTTENLRQNGQVSNGLKVKTDEPLSVEIGDGPKNGKAMEPSPKNAQQLNGFKNGCSTKTPPIFRTRLRDACFVDGAATTKLECYVVGTPTPEVTFYHHESALVDDGRHQIVVNDEVCRLIIQKPIDRVDTGEYSCVAVNELGRDKCSCRLICGDAPGKPSRPEVELSADTEVYINWDPPERIPITMIGITYRLELRQVGEDGSVGPWTIVSNRIEDEAVVLKHLHPMGIYQFRVTSKNEFGWGEPSITSRIIRTHPRGVPKFNLDVLRREGRRFAVVTTPQKSSKRGTGLTEISEEFAEEEEEEEEAAASQTEDSAEAKSPDSSGDQHSPRNDKKNGNGSAQIALNSTEDPLKRFQV